MTQLLMMLEMNNNPALQAGSLLLNNTETLLSTENKKNKGDREVAQRFGALVALAEVQDSISSTHVMAYNHPHFSSRGPIAPF